MNPFRVFLRLLTGSAVTERERTRWADGSPRKKVHYDGKPFKHELAKEVRKSEVIKFPEPSRKKA